MGLLTAAQVELELRSMFPDAKGTRVSSVQILRMINAALQFDLAGRWDIPELDSTDSENCTAAQANITFSVTDVLRIKSVCTNEDGMPLTVTTADGFTRLMARSSLTTGTPTHYHRTGSTTSGQVKLNLYPTPTTTTTLILNYSKRPTVLAVTDVTAIDTLYDEALIEYAAARLARYLGAFGSRDSANLASGHFTAAQSLMAGVCRPVTELMLDSNTDQRYPVYGEATSSAMR